MKTLNRIAVLALLLPLCLMCIEKPDWVENYGKSARLPESSYLTGFGMAKVPGSEGLADAMALAVDNARSNLAQRIQVSIRNVTTTRAEERDNKYYTYFGSSTQSISTLEIEGLNIERYYDEDKEIYYALAVVDAARLVESNLGRIEQIKESVRQCITQGKLHEKGGHRNEALAEYLKCGPFFCQLEKCRMIMSVAQTHAPVDLLAEIPDETEKDDAAETLVQALIDSLVQRPMESVGDVAWYLVHCMKSQMQERALIILITPFTFRDTKLGSEFSRYFMKELEGSCAKETDWQIVQSEALLSGEPGQASFQTMTNSATTYVLRGTMWEQGSAVKFFVTVQRIKDATVAASAEQTVADSIIAKTGLSLKPENFKEAMVAQKYFGENELLDGGLSLEVWTNKGCENPLFVKGERLNMFARVNLPCYIRFIYHLADGKRAVLLDNYYIDETKINKVYQIPEDFECTAPFGAEFLQAFASTEPFEKISVTSQDGYDYLTEDLREFIATTRGVKKVKRVALLTECRVTMTTVAE